LYSRFIRLTTETVAEASITLSVVSIILERILDTKATLLILRLKVISLVDWKPVPPICYPIPNNMARSS